MADHADIAQETVETCQADALRRQLGKSKRVDPRYDGLHCVECEEEVEEPRRRLGMVTCIGCQRIAEARLTMRSHNIRIDDE